MNVLVLNCGSSSLRFQVIDTDLEKLERDADRRLARGHIERVGGHALITLQSSDGKKRIEDAPLRDHRAAVDWVLHWIVSSDSALGRFRDGLPRRRANSSDSSRAEISRAAMEVGSRADTRESRSDG